MNCSHGTAVPETRRYADGLRRRACGGALRDGERPARDCMHSNPLQPPHPGDPPVQPPQPERPPAQPPPGDPPQPQSPPVEPPKWEPNIPPTAATPIEAEYDRPRYS